MSMQRGLHIESGEFSSVSILSVLAGIQHDLPMGYVYVAERVKMLIVTV